MATSSQSYPGLEILNLKNFQIVTLEVSSKSLRGNPLGDPCVRRNPVLIPKGKGPKNGWPVVFVLAGFTGNSPNYFGIKSFQENFPQVVDKSGLKAVFIFVDAMTFWGGSQFLNSKASGRYEDYIIKDLVKAVKKHYPVQTQASKWCVMGGSSGGYGALHLGSAYPEVFAYVAAIAPDSFFESCYLEDIYKSSQVILKEGGIAGIKKLHKKGELIEKPNWHSILNTIGMSACYSSQGELPIDLHTGELNRKVWQQWKKRDPVEFLKSRKGVLKLKKVFLEVGKKDQFALYFGARQIAETLKKRKISLDYNEFNGSHFDLSSRRPYVWAWLKKQWKI